MAAPIAIFQRNYRAGIHKFYTLGDGSSNTPLSDFVNGVPVNETLTLLGGNVGIGSTQPTELLDIKGNVRMDGDINCTGTLRQSGTPYISSQWTTNGKNVYYETKQSINFTSNIGTVVIGWSSIGYDVSTIPDTTSNVIAIAAGVYHALALKPDGSVIGWGNNFFGELNIPAGASNIIAISAGYNWSLALRNDGRVIGWGNNGSGQINIPSSAISNVIAISAGRNHALALKDDGSVIGWGNNSYGQINIPASASNCIAIAASLQSGDMDTAHSLAIKSDGSVIGWGDNSSGQINIPMNANNCIAIAAGGYHSLALKSNGSVIGWGENSHEQITIPISANTDIIAIDASDTYSLALKSDGSVIGWGNNNFGQVTIPASASNCIAIAAGTFNPFALKNILLETTCNIIIGNIGIGTTLPQTTLDVNGSIIAMDNIGIGTSDISLGKLVVAGNIVPSACNVYDLGGLNLRWRDLYLSGNTIDLDGALISRNQEDGGLRVHTRDGVTNLVNITLNNIISSNVLVSGNIGIGTTDTSAGKLVVAGNILPSACNVYDLGTSTLRWRDLYLSGNTIDLDGTTIKKDTITAGIQIGSTNYQYTSNQYAKYISTTSNVILPSSIGTINGVSITALNKRTRTSYAAAKDCVSTWTTRNLPANNGWVSVCWAPELSLFCAVGGGGSGQRVMTSPDGINWTTRASAADNAWRSVCWAPELYLFVAVATSGTGDRVMTSPDGITWTTRTSAADNDWWSVCWAPELSLFCAVAYNNGIGNRVMTSPDGINWTTRASAADNNWRSICWAPELSLFCAVASSGTGNRVMTSPDGIIWTTQTTPTRSWYSLCWSPELSLFVALATTSSFNNNGVMTSPDGINWTIRSGAYTTNHEWWSVCWSPQMSLFVAVAYYNGGIMTSPDGIVWSMVPNMNLELFSICWSPELSIFCAVISSTLLTSGIGMPNAKSVVKALPSQMMVDARGNVGIGSITPIYKMDVVGDINYTGTLYQNGVAFSGGGGSSQWTTSGTDIYYTSGNVGIGITNPDAKLFVNGDINIDRGSRFQFAVGAAKRAYIKSNGIDNALEFGSESLEHMRIHGGSGYVGIGTTNPQTKLHISSTTDTILTVQTTNNANKAEVAILGNDQGTGRLFVGQSASYGGGIEYNGDNSPVTTGAGADCITLFRRDNGTDSWTARNPYNTNDWEFRGNISGATISGTHSGTLKPGIDFWHTSTDNQARFWFANGGRTYFRSGSGFEFRSAADVNIGSLDNSGNLVVPGEIYTNTMMRLNYNNPTICFQDTDHNTGFIHVNSSIMYVLRGGNNTTSWSQVNGEWPWTFNLTNNDSRCGGALTVVGNITTNYLTTSGITSTGSIYTYMLAQTNSGTDLLGTTNAAANNTGYQKFIRIMYNTFTGMHRNFTDDELFNIEDPNLFKTTYVGRIVISIGDIATHTSTDTSIEDKEGMIQWEIKRDKEGITIEDALPIVRLSRQRKDKRVFGVLGMAERNNSHAERLIINSLGEGAMWVVNTNGSIENGDYIQSSPELGYGERQDDDLLHNYTVAKATIPCDFTLNSPKYECIELNNGVRAAFIAVTYHCG